VSQVPLYDALAADYDRFVNWEGRLAHELPFLERLFRAQAVRRVLDTACGTGQHAIALAKRGYQVTGTDLSTAMIERARENVAAAGVEVSLAAVGLGRLATLGQTFDAVLCLGNSLPHLLTATEVAEALADLASVLCPGGLLVIQNRNFDRVWARKERFMGPQSHRDGDDEWLFVRFYDFHEETVTFNMIRLRRERDGWTQNIEATELRPIFRDDLETVLAQTGFSEITLYGGCDGSAFEPAASGDLIAVGKRG
jgi:glycine/sarcosine N-methyltransferase